MLTENLFERILMEPASRGANRLYIVSGYATPAMAFHHLDVLKQRGMDIRIELILGMCALEGLGQSRHLGFKELAEASFKDAFKCSYLVNIPPIHSKAYAWFDDDGPIAGFVGSANYTQAAFSERRRELMVQSDAEECLRYFRSLVEDTIYCDHIDVEQEIVIYPDRMFEYRQRMGRLTEDIVASPEAGRPAIEGLDYVRISLLDRNGNLPPRSGLNWGQRPEYRREPNQAYIRIPADIGRTDFFPPRGEHFTIITDDRKVLICTRAQQNAKAIECPHNNSLIGLYFRGRMGLESGRKVSKDDLLRFGRTHVDFYKIDSETYYMDFSPEL